MLKEAKTALLIGTYESGKEKELKTDFLNELKKLCETYGLEVALQIPCLMKKIDVATFLGKGKLEEILLEVQEKGIDVVVFDEEITPSQQRNLEKFFQKPVIDRTELIIEVFAQSAHTREATLQVELAKVRYQLPRLKRMWTHLSRQTAGGGSAGAYLRGPGELQIELDRRMLKRRILQLQTEIEQVEKQRQTQRQQRRRQNVPSFAIVGYTNSGKSTLLNALTDARVLVEDKLFATLDTTTRKYTLPNRQEIVLVDTVGFIRKIPHMVVAAFKSTLEESLYTDVLLHLIDCSHPMAELQAEATIHVLNELGAKQPIITVLNKIDACFDPSIIYRFCFKYPKVIQISALTGQGFDLLLEKMTEEIRHLRQTVKLRIPQESYALVTELMREATILEQEYEENDVLLEAEVPVKLMHKVKPFLNR